MRTRADARLSTQTRLWQTRSQALCSLLNSQHSPLPTGPFPPAAEHREHRCAFPVPRSVYKRGSRAHNRHRAAQARWQATEGRGPGRTSLTLGRCVCSTMPSRSPPQVHGAEPWRTLCMKITVVHQLNSCWQFIFQYNALHQQGICPLGIYRIDCFIKVIQTFA